MTGAIFFFALGALLIWIGWRHWRYRNQETISGIELGILKITGQEPLPRTRFDHVFTYISAICGLLLGLFFLLIGIVGILVELEML